MKSICFIGARGGSKGVPRKNIRKLGKKPLIAYTIESALKSNLFEHVIVSTEDTEIANISKKFGAEVPFIRPKKLATDSAGFADVMIHAIDELKNLNYDFDVLVNRDCTVPFIRISDLKNSLKLFEKNKPDAVYGVCRQHFNPYFNIMEKNPEGFLKLSKRLKIRPKSRQDAPIVYQLNGLYTYDTKKFLQIKKTDFGKCLMTCVTLNTS